MMEKDRQNVRICPHCGSDNLSYGWGDYLCMDCDITSSKKECEKAGTIKAMELCFKELVDKQKTGINWVHIKGLYQCTKKKINELYSFPIKRFHELLLELYDTPNFEDRKVDFSRGSSVTPGTSRYGIHTERGIYAYVKFRRKE